MLESAKNELGITRKAELILKIMNNESSDDFLSRFTASQMQDLRNFLENQLIYLSSLKSKPPLSLTDIKSHYEPIPNYYYRQDCREPLEACFNEACLANNPQCFANKMRGQVKAMLSLLHQFINSGPMEHPRKTS